MKVKIKKLDLDAIIPKYQTSGSSGFDLHVLEDTYIDHNDTTTVRTGLAFQVPSGYELQIRPRSGLSLKTGLRVANAPGTVDSDFLGEVKIIIHNTGPCTVVRKGDRIAQGVVCPIQQVEFEEVYELEQTERGEGGFGSTGSK